MDGGLDIFITWALIIVGRKNIEVCLMYQHAPRRNIYLTHQELTYHEFYDMYTILNTIGNYIYHKSPHIYEYI